MAPLLAGCSVLDSAQPWCRRKALGIARQRMQRKAAMMYCVWKLGQMVAQFPTRDGALGYVTAHLGEYDDYEITDESDEL